MEDEYRAEDVAAALERAPDEARILESLGFAVSAGHLRALCDEAKRLQAALTLISTAVVDGRHRFDIWDTMNIATNALAGKEDLIG